jgi:hypothetical protein
VNCPQNCQVASTSDRTYRVDNSHKFSKSDLSKELLLDELSSIRKTMRKRYRYKAGAEEERLEGNCVMVLNFLGASI